MTPARGEVPPSSTVKAVLYGIAHTGLTRASLVLALCIIIDADSDYLLPDESFLVTFTVDEIMRQGIVGARKG